MALPDRNALQVRRTNSNIPEPPGKSQTPTAAGGGPADELPLGALKAIFRSEHICFGCNHFAVCKVACAIDINLLTTVSSCLMFEPAMKIRGAS